MDKNKINWLTGLVLEAASIASFGIKNETDPHSSLQIMGVHHGLNGSYEIFGKKTETGLLPLAQAKDFKFYAAKLPSGQMGLMKISSIPSNNFILENEVRILDELHQTAQEIDKDAIGKSQTPPYYGAMFPTLVEKIDANGRVALFLGFNEIIKTYKQMEPLSLVVGPNDRVDFKTVQWIFGKLLKFLSFIHSNGFVVDFIDPSNIFLETRLHGIFVLDFSKAKENVTEEECLKEVAVAAKIALCIADGTETSYPQHHADLMSYEFHIEYTEFLRQVIRNPRSAADEFDELYKLSDKIWPKVPKPSGAPGLKRQFHNFCIYKK